MFVSCFCVAKKKNSFFSDSFCTCKTNGVHSIDAWSFFEKQHDSCAFTNFIENITYLYYCFQHICPAEKWYSGRPLLTDRFWRLYYFHLKCPLCTFTLEKLIAFMHALIFSQQELYRAVIINMGCFLKA